MEKYIKGNCVIFSKKETKKIIVRADKPIKVKKGSDTFKIKQDSYFETSIKYGEKITIIPPLSALFTPGDGIKINIEEY